MQLIHIRNLPVLEFSPGPFSSSDGPLTGAVTLPLNSGGRTGGMNNNLPTSEMIDLLVIKYSSLVASKFVRNLGNY